MLHQKELTSDESQLIGYQTFKILNSKIHATYDARKVISELDKMVELSESDLFDYLKSKYPTEDSVQIRRLIRSEGIKANSVIQVRAVDLMELGTIEMTSDDK